MEMNAPVPKFMIESTWRGRLFGAEWRAASGGSIDVVEPATGATITRVGNAGAEDVRRAAAEARAAQPERAATPYEKRAAILRKAARTLEDNQEELIPWIARETRGHPGQGQLRDTSGDRDPLSFGGHVHRTPRLGPAV
jgi:benzaldehyde dehydrogenase (NAD)